MSNDNFINNTEQSEQSREGALKVPDSAFLHEQVDNQISPLFPSSITTVPPCSSSLISSSAAPVAVPAFQNNNNSLPDTHGQPEFGGAGILQTSGFSTPTPCIVGALDLNYADREELLRERLLLSENRRYCLRLMETKLAEYSEGIPDAYFDSGYLVLGLANEKFALRYACCGRPQGKGSVPCKAWMFCESCAKRQTSRALARYGNIFNKGTFFFVTISFAGDLPFTTTTSTQVLSYWESINAALKSMCDSGVWRGAYWVNELHVDSFLPIRVLPHAHAIIDADRVTQDQLDELSKLVSEYTGDEDVPVEIILTPSIDAGTLQPLASERHLENTIAYLTKATNLVKPYSTAWRNYVTDDRNLASHLNREARELLEGIPALIQTIKGKKRKWCKGTMDPINKKFIGNSFTKKKPHSKRKKTKNRRNR